MSRKELEYIIAMLAAQATSLLLRMIAEECNVTIEKLTVQQVLDYIVKHTAE